MIQKKDVRILLVEDNEGDATLIKKLLGELGPKSPFSVDVEWSSDGEAALHQMLRPNLNGEFYTPDAVLLDINLPRKNGFEVLASMQKDARLKKIPVFILTTSKAYVDIERSYSSNAVSYITKPGNFSALEDVVERFLSIELPRVLKD